MPDPFERHARSAEDGWGPRPPRSQQRAGAARDDPARARVPGKKDPALCKAAHWKGLHQPGLRLMQWALNRGVGCGWIISWDSDERCDTIGYRCSHEEACTGCGRILRDRIPRRECPEYRAATAEERAELEEELARCRAARAGWMRRKPVITGPQGYRRRKAGRA
jgi:hypothetical protein